MAPSRLRQLGKLLDKTADVVPATLCSWTQEYAGGVFSSYTLRTNVDEAGSELLAPTYLVTYLCKRPPIITIVSPSGIPHVRSPLCSSENVSPPGKMIRSLSLCFNTWHNLCSEPCFTGPAANKHNRVGKRGRGPGCVPSSRHTVIVF